MYALAQEWESARSMGKFLRFEEVTQKGSVEIGRSAGDVIFVGREPGEFGITLDRSSVSRRHGVFQRCGTVWLYKDLGSTNGSWINGRRLEADRFCIARSGDMVQLADVALCVRESGDGKGQGGAANIGGRSLLAFYKGDFSQEFPIPEYVRALVVGGSTPDLELEGDLFEMPSLVVERRGDAICAFSVARELPVYLNGVDFSETITLTDGDELRISNYSILLNDPTHLKSSSVAGEIVEPGAATGLKGWISQQRPGAAHPSSAGDTDSAVSSKVMRKSVFGQQVPQDDGDETIPIDLRGVQRGGISHPSLRSVALYRKNRPQREYSLASFEDKVILGVGFSLLLALMILVIWWAMG